MATAKKTTKDQAPEPDETTLNGIENEVNEEETVEFPLFIKGKEYTLTGPADPGSLNARFSLALEKHHAMHAIKELVGNREFEEYCDAGMARKDAEAAFLAYVEATGVGEE